MCGLHYNRGAERISASAVSARIRIGLMGLPQTSPLHWLRVVGPLIGDLNVVVGRDPPLLPLSILILLSQKAAAD